MRIDTHQHFWDYSENEYPWIGGKAPLNRSYLPEELNPLLRAARIDRVITVQARSSLEDTRWMLRLAQRHDWIAGVVGWASLEDPQLGKVLEEFSWDRKLRGIRAPIHRAGREAMAALRERKLVLDLLLGWKEMGAAITIADRFPQNVFVLDHGGNPDIQGGQLEPWRLSLMELARRPNVYCKLSGLATKANHKTWTMKDLKPYVDTIMAGFGPRRVLFGSDWPVSLQAVDYGSWVSTVEHLVPSSEHEAVFGDTALRVYGV